MNQHTIFNNGVVVLAENERIKNGKQKTLDTNEDEKNYFSSRTITEVIKNPIIFSMPK